MSTAKLLISSHSLLTGLVAAAGSYETVDYVSTFLPDYFATYGRKEPQTMNHVPITFANGHPDKTYYDYLSMEKAKLRQFMLTMTALEDTWPIGGVYDFSWVVENVKKEQRQ